MHGNDKLDRMQRNSNQFSIAKNRWQWLLYPVGKYGIVGVLLLTVLLHLKFLDVSQIWDGYIYYAQLLKALSESGSWQDFLHNLNIAGHPTMGYMALMAIGQWMDYGNPILLNASNLLLLLLAVWAFYKILLFFSPAEDDRPEMLMITLLFSLNPVLFGASIFFNVDFPVAIFLVCVLYAILYEKYFLAGLFGLLLVFSKETGIILYGGIITLFAVVPLLPRLFPLWQRYAPGAFMMLFRGQRLSVILKVIWVALPLPLSLYYWLIYNRTENWIGGPIVSIAWDSPIAFTRLFQMFGINFQWLLSLCIILALIRICQAKDNIWENLSDWKVNSYHLWALIILWGGFVIMNLFLKTFTNVRYVLPAIIFLILFFSLTLKKVFVRRGFRIAMIAVVIFLTGWQVFQTVDPVSRAFFGTIPFGNHPLLKMTSVTGECCGRAGRDQLVYNAEFAMIPRLLDKLYAEIPLAGESNIIVHPLGNFNIFTPVDEVSRQRTMQYDNAFFPHVYGFQQIIRGVIPATGYYVYLPWMEDAKRELDFVQHFFAVQDKKVIAINGYSLDVYSVTARGR
jgi:hypothetical protein